MYLKIYVFICVYEWISGMLFQKLTSEMTLLVALPVKRLDDVRKQEGTGKEEKYMKVKKQVNRKEG